MNIENRQAADGPAVSRLVLQLLSDALVRFASQLEVVLDPDDEGVSEIN